MNFKPLHILDPNINHNQHLDERTEEKLRGEDLKTFSILRYIYHMISIIESDNISIMDTVGFGHRTLTNFFAISNLQKTSLCLYGFNKMENI